MDDDVDGSATPSLDLTSTSGASPVAEKGPRKILLSEAWVRAGLAYVFAGIFVVTVVLAFGNVGSKSWANTKELLQLLLPAETAILGSAVGFYFGSHRQ